MLFPYKHVSALQSKAHTIYISFQLHWILIRDLDAEDPEGFRQFHRMIRESFYELLAVVSPLVSKRDTHMQCH